MKVKDIKNIIHSLAFRVIFPVSVLVLIAGIMLYIFVLRYVSDFTEQHIKETFSWVSREIYSVCDKNLTELLKAGNANNKRAVRIQKGLTVGNIEDFLMANNLKGIIEENGRELLSCCNSRESSMFFIENVKNKKFSLIEHKGIRYYAYQTYFEPWDWRIVIIKNAADYSALTSRLTVAYAATGAVLAAVALLILCYLNRTIRHPVSTIISSLKESKQPEYKGIYEFEFLSQSISEMMSERQRMIKHIIDEQKLKGIRILAAGVAHNFNNMLVGVLGYASLMRMRLENAAARQQPLEERDIEEFLKYTKIIESSAQKAGTLARDLSGLSKKRMLEDGATEPVDINRLATEIQRLISDTFPKNIEVSAVINNNVPLIKGDATQLEQALLNIAINSKDAMPDGGKLIIKTFLTDIVDGNSKYYYLKAGKYAAIQISDTGAGMDEDTLSHIFEPFFTTKPVDKGTGLGLATVYSIIKAHRGYVIAESIPDKGSTFTIYLPIE
jgi:signal transduction histidine kinase